MNKKQYFLEIFGKAEKKYKNSQKRLAGEAWKEDWQTLFATILSAQSRDETTIPIAERLFKEYPALKSLSEAKFSEVTQILKSINYYKTKSKHIITSAKIITENYNSKVPNTINELIKLPGVGRKTANLFLSEIHNQHTITVDTHVHRISNVLEIVKTKSPHETEFALQKIAPKHLWSKINRYFVLWGKDCPSRDKKKLLACLEK